MELPRYWRLQRERYLLEGAECVGCGEKLFPARSVCPECSSRELVPFRFAGIGEVYSFSTIHKAPEGFEEYAPFTVALVKLDEGPLITAQLTDVDPEEVVTGLPVEMVTRKLSEDGPQGPIVYGYKFRPRIRRQ